MTKHLFAALLPLLASCGISTAKYIDYTDENTAGTGTGTNGGVGTGTDGGAGAGSGTSTTSAECTAALTEFTAQVQPAIASCSCHLAGTKIAGKSLVANNAETNRATLKFYVKVDQGGDGAKFAAFIGGPAHGGGNQSSSLPAAKINAWWAKEPACTQ